MSKAKQVTDIEQLRRNVDQIDKRIARLLHARVRLASKIILAKKQVAKPITDPKRERAITKHYLAVLKQPITNKHVRTLVRSILELTPPYKN